MGQVLLPVGSIPPTPATGYTAFYVGTDKKLYFIDDAGVIHPTEAPVLSSPGPIGNVTPSTIASTQFTGPLTGNVLGGASMAGSGSYFCMRNKLINGNFAINQRVQVTGVALAAGIYGHDRWKAGAGGCTYTFTQTKPDTLLTITAGTLVQVIEDVNCTEVAYIISWAGTALGRADSGSYSASPLLVSGKTPGTQMQIEFGTGTLGTVQVEAGTVPTPFERRFISIELSLCQRYYEKSFGYGAVPTNGATTTTAAEQPYACVSSNIYGAKVYFSIEKSNTPTLKKYGNSQGYWFSTTWNSVNSISNPTTRGFQVIQQETNGIAISVGHWTAEAEL